MASATYYPYAQLKGVMNELISSAAREEDIRQLVINLTAGLEELDYLGQAETLFVFVRDKIRYVEDPEGEDLYQSPEKTLQVGAGDCNNKTCLLGALAKSIGFPVQICWAFLTPPTTDADMAFHVWLELDVTKGQRLDPMEQPIRRWMSCETIPGKQSYGRLLWGRKLPFGASFMSDPDFPAKYVEKVFVS